MIVGVAILADGIIYALPRPARHCHLFAEHNVAQRESIRRKREAGEDVPIGWLTCAAFIGWPAAVLGLLSAANRRCVRREPAVHQQRVTREMLVVASTSDNVRR